MPLPERSLRREIVWALAVKLAAILLLWALFFSPPHRPQVGQAEMAAVLSGGAR